MVAPAHKRKKVGRCKFHDGGKCKYGDRCRFNHIGAAGNGHPPPAGHSPYYSPGTAQTAQSSVPAVPADDVAVANLASMVAKMLTGIAFHAQCSVTAVAKVLLTTLQRRREMSAKGRKSKQESGDISCADGCDVIVHKQESNEASALITVPVVCDTAATMPVVGADLSKAVDSFKKTKVSVSLDTANGLKHIA